MKEVKECRPYDVTEELSRAVRLERKKMKKEKKRKNKCRKKGIIDISLFYLPRRDVLPK